MTSLSFVLVLALFFSPFVVSGVKEPAKGNAELKAALDRAAVLAFREGKWAETFGQENGVNLPFICGDWKTLSLYPQPKENETTLGGALDDVLKTQVLNAAYVKTEINLIKYDGTSYSAINSNNPESVTGVFTEWHVALVQQLNSMYNKAITINYVIRDSPTEALQTVVNGDAHLAITPFRTDLTYKGFPRSWRFLPGCPDNGLTTGALYQMEDYQRFNSYAELLETGGHKIGALSSKCNVYKMTFVESNVECSDNTTFLEDGLASGHFDVISENIDDTIVIPGSLPTTAFGSFYRMDDPCSPAVVVPSSGEKLVVLWSSLLVLVVGWLVVL